MVTSSRFHLLILARHIFGRFAMIDIDDWIFQAPSLDDLTRDVAGRHVTIDTSGLPLTGPGKQGLQALRI